MATRKKRPSAYLWTMTYETGDKNRRVTLTNDNPFGEPGVDYSATFDVKCEPLYKAAP